MTNGLGSLDRLALSLDLDTLSLLVGKPRKDCAEVIIDVTPDEELVLSTDDSDQRDTCYLHASGDCWGSDCSGCNA